MSILEHVSDEFTRQAESYRRELLAHCYRMTGSAQDAEDLVQETYLRAWRAHEGFEGRSSLRTWLYRIATNACLNALRQKERRALPSGLGTESASLDDPEAGTSAAWLEPLPDLAPEVGDPADIAAARAGVRLALVASLQLLPPRQRAVLIMRDVLAWPAADVARALELSVVAVKSLLQRARSRLAAVAPDMDDVLEPDHPKARALLDGYMRAFENADAAEFERLLRADAVLEVVPGGTWFDGKRDCVALLVRHVTLAAGDWLTVPTVANGQPAFAGYLRAPDGGHQGYGLGVLTVTETGIAKVSVFEGVGHLIRFGLPTAR
ncbi:sigma-70 family RNA polymerase sigma factor [Pseudonocardia eucalypti]|uniref:RNA polymerase sigma factor n=1 Tax=Pseudonocardia eucalypti TaxID=648755 RepID=A0ABP9QEN4_9PSEU|nr:RNA polymerase sigma-70 factor (ECF subfamily) [Pseudonocardia eucalypti]